MAPLASASSDPTQCGLCAGPTRTWYRFGTHSVVYCRACRLGQLAPLPTPTELAALYASRDYFEGSDRIGYAGYVADAPQLARTFRAKLALLWRHGAVRDLLEVGCGPGYLLAEARALGIAGVAGVDANPWAIEAARGRGLEAYVGSIEAVPAGRTFDAVALLDVLEHVPEPLRFLDAVRARLHPGGRLLIMTPNIRSLLARVSGRRWVSFKVPEHVYYYSRTSLRQVLAAAGFTVLAMRGSGQYVTVDFLLSRLARLAPRPTAALAALARRLGLGRRVVFVTNGSLDVVARVASGAPPR